MPPRKYINIKQTTLALSIMLLWTQAVAPCALAQSPPGPKPPWGTLDLTIVRSPRTKPFEDAIEKARKLFRSSDWKNLEAYLTEEDKLGNAMPDGGLWITGMTQAQVAVEDIGWPPGAKGKKDFESYLKAIDDWQKKIPNSAYAATVRGEALTNWAWDARGCDWADKVSDENFKLFHERLEKAKTVLESCSQKARPPRWYPTLMQVYLGLGEDRAAFDKVLKAALKAYPKQIQSYNQMIIALLPRWGGEEGEWEKFASSSADQVGGADGDLLYARIAIFMIRSFGDELRSYPPDFARIERGIAEMKKRYPDDPTPDGLLCRIALVTGHKDKAKELIEKLGTKMPKFAFDSKLQFTQVWNMTHGGDNSQ